MNSENKTRNLRPVTPGSRGTVVPVKTREMSKKVKLLKSLKRKKNSINGRNNAGRITVRRRGGAHKRHIRVVDFKRNDNDGVVFVVKALHYDPNRSAYLALISSSKTGKYSYIIAPQSLNVGDKIQSGNNLEPNVGNYMPLRDIPTNKRVFCVEMKPGKGAQLARSAGAYVQFQKEGEYAILKLRSGEIRQVLLECRACIGVASNADHKNIKLGKAGASRHRGRRPKVRGVAMNPVDHPHGGGEGRTSGGRHPVSPWGTPAKGYKTRKNKRTDKYIVRRRKKK